MTPVVIEPYNSEWPRWFTKLRGAIWPAVSDVAVMIEHVGSTSVPGLAAKAIIDLDVVIRDRSLLTSVIARLAGLGYEHQGNLGIQDREAFRGGPTGIRHNLYVCPSDSIALRSHLCVREALRGDVDLRIEYASLKHALARQFPNSLDAYAAAKTPFILSILARHGYGPDSLEAIRLANRQKGDSSGAPQGN